MKKIIKLDTFKAIWTLMGAFLFFVGIICHDWIMMIGGFLMNLDTIDIVHYHGGKEYKQ